MPAKSNKLTLYIPEEAKGIIKTAKEIFKREKSSLSQFLIKSLIEYNRLHEPGNPQQRIDTILDIGHAFRAEACCICSKKPEIEAFTVKGLKLLYCRECYDKTGRLRTTAYRKWLEKKD